MAYVRHEWACEEMVTSEKLNNIEDGVAEALACGGSASFIVNITESEETCEGGDDHRMQMDKTYAEIVAALNSGYMPMLISYDSGSDFYVLPIITDFGYVDGEYVVWVYEPISEYKTWFSSTTTNGTLLSACGLQ